MGVKSLWRLLEPAAKPRRVETLAGQKLAIDASIWLHQFLKAMRDKEGNLIKGAHIVGFYRRICKLLYFGIRPVFIFDGDTPAMKRVALTERRQRKTTAKNNLAKTAHKILYKRLQLEALQRNENANLAREIAERPEPSGFHRPDALQEIPDDVVYMDQIDRHERGHNVPEVGSLLPKKIAAKSDPFLSKKRKERLDEYELPEESKDSYIAEDPRLISKDEMISFVDHYKDDINLNDLNLDDQRFKELPIEMQHDIVTEVKTKSRLANHRRLATMINAAPDALKFSALQIKHLVNRNNLTERLQHLSKNANVVSNPGLKKWKAREAQRPRRVASERNREYMLVKNEDTGGHTLKLLAQYGGKGAGTGGLNGQKASSSNEVIDLASDDNDEARGEDWLHLLRMHGQGHHAKKLDADAPSSPSTSAAIPGSSSQKRRAYTRKTQIPTEKSSDMSNSVTDDRTSKDVITSSHSHSEVNDLSDDDEEFEEIPPAPQSTLSAVDGHREKSSLLIDQDAYVPDALSTEQIMEMFEGAHGTTGNLSPLRTDQAAKAPKQSNSKYKIHEIALFPDSEESLVEGNVLNKAPETKSNGTSIQGVQKRGRSSSNILPFGWDSDEELESIPSSLLSSPKRPRRAETVSEFPSENQPLKSMFSTNGTQGSSHLQKSVETAVSHPTSGESLSNLETDDLDNHSLGLPQFILAECLNPLDAYENLVSNLPASVWAPSTSHTPSDLKAAIFGTASIEQCKEWITGAQRRAEKATSSSDTAKTHTLWCDVLKAVVEWRVLRNFECGVSQSTSDDSSPRAEFGPCTPPRDRSSVQRLNAEKTTVPLEEPLIDIPIPQTPSRRKETLPHTPSPFKRAINATANMLGFASDDSGNSDDDEEFEVVNSIDTSQSQNGSFEQVETPVGLPTPKSISIIRKEGGEGHSKSVVDLQNEIGASVLSTLTSLKPPQTPATIETQEPREMPVPPATPSPQRRPASLNTTPEVRVNPSQDYSSPLQPDHDADAHFDDFIPATTAMDENEAQIDVPDIPMEEEEEFARFVSSLSNQTREDVEKRLETEMVSLNKKKRAEEAGAVDIEGELIRDIQSLLTIFGLPYLVAPMEAESQCAWLVTAKLVDGIVTDDSDVFLFGGTRIYKNMFNQQKYVEEYTAERLYETMNLTRENLIQLAYLLGSDYTEGIEGVGPTGAMEVLAEWGGEGLEPLERFREWWEGVLRNPTAIVSTENATLRRLRRLCSKLSIPASFPDSRVCDAYLHPMLNEDPTAFTWGTPDLDALRDFMEYKLHWPQHTVDSVMIPLLREMERNLTTRSEQSRLDDFFSVESRRKEAEDETEDNEKRLAMARLKNSERVKKGVATLKRSRKRGGGVGTSGAPPTATTNGTQGATDAGVGGSGPSAKPTRGRRASTRGGRGKKRGS